MCDFDGTITVQDTAEWLLAHHADGDWRALDDLYVQGKISLLECMRLQFSMIKADKVEILKELESAISIRPGFRDLVEVCSEKGAEMIIVSAGLDFVIQYFMVNLRVYSRVSVYSAKTFMDEGHFHIKFPPLTMPGSISFKDDVVRQRKAMRQTIIYLGDGVADLEASALADHRYAVAGKKLESGLRARGLKFRSFTDFHDILPEINVILNAD